MAVAGVFSSGGVRIERSDYGIPDVVDCNHQIHLVSESFVEQVQYHSLQSSGDLELRLAYGGGGLQHLLAAVLFSHLDVSPLDLGGGLYLHYFELERSGNTRVATPWDSSSPSGKNVFKRLTALVKRGDNTTVEVVSFQPTGLSFDIGESPRLTANGQAARINTNPESSGSGLCFSYVPVGMLFLQHGSITLYPLHKWSFSSDRTIVVTEEGAASSVTVLIPSGDYLAVELAREIEKQLNASPDLSGRYWVFWEGDIRKFLLRSNIKFSIENTGDINNYIGFPAGSSLAHLHRSSTIARSNVNDTTGIDLQVASISFIISNGFQKSPNLKTAWEADESRVEAPPSVRVTIEFHRPQFWNVGELTGEYFALKASFAHPDGIGKMDFFVNNMQLITPEAAVSGEQQIKERLAFESQDTGFNNFSLFFDDRFMVRTLPPAPSSIEMISVGTYERKLYAGNGDLNVYRLDNSGWTSIGSVGDPATALASYQGKLYIGTDNGDLYIYDGSTITYIGHTVTSVVNAIEPFDGKVYMILASGEIYHYDGSSLVKDTSAPPFTVGHDLIAANGVLYALGRYNSERIYAFDGSTWSIAYDFISTENTGCFTRLEKRKRLVAIAGTKGAYIDIDGAGGWSSYPYLFGEEMKYCLGYDSELLLLSSTGKLYWYDDDAYTGEHLLTTLGSTVRYKPIQFENRAVFPIDTNLRYVQIPYILHLKLQDKTNFNPYI